MTSAAAVCALDDHRPTTISATPWVVGFFLIARNCLTFLFFTRDPALGSLVSIAFGLVLLYIAVLTEGHRAAWTVWRDHACIRLIAIYLVLALASLLWTGTQSRVSAFAYWLGLCSDPLIVIVLLSDRANPLPMLDRLLQGATLGGVVLALVGWFSPVTPDLRLGDLVFLHPNTLGLELGLTGLFAFYLSRRGAFWKWIAVLLAITLLRTLSKTSILAFAIACGWLLLRGSTFSRSAKIRIALLTSIVLAGFSGLVTSYLQIYNTTGSGNQLETLTGRTVLWATAIGMGLQAPWLGHGFYSFRSLIPAFGDFEPWHAHNEAVQTFFEFGTVGLIVVIAVHLAFWRAMQRSHHSALRPLSLALLIFALLHGLTDTVPFGFSYPIWLLVGLSLAAAPAKESEERT